MMMSTAVKIRPLPFSNVKALNSVFLTTQLNLAKKKLSPKKRHPNNVMKSSLIPFILTRIY